MSDYPFCHVCGYDGPLEADEHYPDRTVCVDRRACFARWYAAREEARRG